MLRVRKTPKSYSAVLRERVAEQQAAARAERQPVDLFLLRVVRRDPERQPHHVLVGADREAADSARGRQVLFEQRRRDAQHAGLVVEPVALVVGGQQVGDVHLQVEQIADGVAVLGAVQPVHRLEPGIGMLPRLRFELPFERGGERRRAWPRRAAACPAAASCRRASCAPPSPRSRRARRRRPGSCPSSDEPAGLGARVVAGDAVLSEPARRRARGRRRLPSRRGQPARVLARPWDVRGAGRAAAPCSARTFPDQAASASSAPHAPIPTAPRLKPLFTPESPVPAGHNSRPERDRR